MKFSIRDLLLVTVIVAICVAWGLDRTQLAHEMERMSKMSLTGRNGSYPQHNYHVPTSQAPAPNPPKP